jgi:hypothetical protein
MSFYATAHLLIRDHPYNYTFNSTEECTLTTCSILQAQYTYDPSLTGNAFLASFFSLLIFFQIILGIYYRTIGFSIAMSCGLILEVIGYIGRVQMHTTALYDVCFSFRFLPFYRNMRGNFLT